MGLEVWLIPSISAITSILATGGFWTYIQSRNTKKTAADLLLLGLAQDRIVSLGMKYIERGWITKDEYEDYIQRLYEPYSSSGGNGLAERVMKEVSMLKIFAQQRPVTTPVQVISVERSDHAREDSNAKDA